MIQVEAIDHRPRSHFIYTLDARTLQIRLRARKRDLDACLLIYGDKFEPADRRRREPMTVFATDELFDYWEITIRPPNRRLAYVFECVQGGETVWLNEKGIDRAPPHPAMSLYFFEYSQVYRSDVFQPPAWVNDTVFYQIFVDRFRNGDPSNDPPGTLPWEAPPDRRTFRGGDLRGIADRLDDLAELGVNGLYLTPVFASPSNHKYDIFDYRRIDPHFGDAADLRELVRRAHARGMRVILDIVLNHCSSDFPPFRDAERRGPASPYWDWFLAHEHPFRDGPRPSYATFAFEPGMPKLNTENEELRAYLIETMVYWMTETGIDGWRIDVASDVDHTFLRQVRAAVKRCNPEALLLGEIWYDALPWLGGDQLDSVMNYNLAHPIKKYLAEGEWNARQFAEHVGRQLAAYPQTVTNALFNVLDSHDTERLLHTCRGDARRMKLAVLFQFLYNGAPCIYYGDEIGMTGEYDPDCRRSMVWDEERHDTELHGFYRWLIASRKRWPAWRSGRLTFLEADPDANRVVLLKQDERDRFLIALNNTAFETTVPLRDFRLSGEWTELAPDIGRAGAGSAAAEPAPSAAAPLPAAARLAPFGFRMYRQPVAGGKERDPVAHRADAQ